MFLTIRLLSLALLLCSALPVSAQTLFFDLLPTKSWLVPASEYGALPQVSTLSLHAVSDTTRTLPPATVIWQFRQRLLVRGYDVASGRMVTLGSYAYQMNYTRASLLIFFDEKVPTSYNVGITSSGRFAMLFASKAHAKRK